MKLLGVTEKHDNEGKFFFKHTKLSSRCAVAELTQGRRKERRAWDFLFQGDLRSGEKRHTKFSKSQSVTG